MNNLSPPLLGEARLELATFANERSEGECAAKHARLLRRASASSCMRRSIARGGGALKSRDAGATRAQGCSSVGRVGTCMGLGRRNVAKLSWAL